MIRLEKARQLDRIKDENERKKLINEIKASGPALKLVHQILQDKIRHIEGSLITNINEPYLLAANVLVIAELKKLTQLFEETTDE